MKTTILTLVAVMFLSACGGKAIVKGEEQKLRAQPIESMVDCTKPHPIIDKTLAGVIDKLKESIQLLGDCSEKQKELSDWIKRGS
jgi:hypothetical protein